MNKGNGLKALNMIHKAMLIGQIIFAGICFYLLYSKTLPPGMEELDRALQVTAVILAATGFFIGASLFKKRLLLARGLDAPAADKFLIYRSACIIQWALLEGPSLFCIIGFFLTGNYAFLLLSGTLIILFAMITPTKMKVAFQLGISEEELSEL